MMDQLRALMVACLEWLRRRWPKRPLSYWLIAFAILGASIWLSPYIDDYFHLVGVRNWLFQNLNQSATNPARPRSVKLVIIRDDEFWQWGGELAHRVPTNRHYISRIVDALDRANAGVIALDFDMRLADPDAKGSAGDYREIDPAYLEETEALIRSIDRAAENRPVVLSRTIMQHPDFSYYAAADIYQPFGICNDLFEDGRWLNPGTSEFKLSEAARENISCGYIQLPRDLRQVPPALDIGRKSLLGSFSAAIVRAKSQTTAPILNDRAYYATYIPEEVLDDPSVTVSARDLLSNDPKTFHRVARLLRGNPVIVGAGWHRSARGVGEMIDMHLTPIEQTNGAVIHENFTEAMMSDRLYPAVSSAALHWFEIAMGVLAIIGFAISQNIWIRIAALVGASLLLFAIQWLTLQILGTFFEAFIPVFGVGLHAIIERLVSKE